MIVAFVCWRVELPVMLDERLVLNSCAAPDHDYDSLLTTPRE